VVWCGSIVQKGEREREFNRGTRISGPKANGRVFGTRTIVQQGIFNMLLFEGFSFSFCSDTVHSTQYTVHSTQYTVHSLQATGHSTQSTVHSPQSTVHSPQSTVHSPQSTVHSPQFKVHSTQCVPLLMLFFPANQLAPRAPGARPTR
jgi:hypothetical protein